MNALVGAVDSLPDGGYWLEWHVVSADGHPVDGLFIFAVGAVGAVMITPPPPDANDMVLPEPEPAIPVVAAALRGIPVGLLMALAGLLGFRCKAVSPLSAASERRSQRVATWLSVGAMLFCVAHLAAWLMNVSPTGALDADTMGAIVGSAVGKLELWRTGLVVLACWALFLARRAALALVFASAALLVSGAIGHWAAISPIVATPAKAVHLAGGALWLGGLIWLLVLADEDRAFTAEARRVSRVALVGVLLILVSGLVQTFLFLPAPADVIRTKYGALAIAKFVGLLVLIAFGAQHRFRSLPRLEHDPAVVSLFRTSLQRDVAVMALVILLGGVLAYVPPSVH